MATITPWIHLVATFLVYLLLFSTAVYSRLLPQRLSSACVRRCNAWMRWVHSHSRLDRSTELRTFQIRRHWVAWSTAFQSSFQLISVRNCFVAASHVKEIWQSSILDVDENVDTAQPYCLQEFEILTGLCRQVASKIIAASVGL